MLRCASVHDPLHTRFVHANCHRNGDELIHESGRKELLVRGRRIGRGRGCCSGWHGDASPGTSVYVHRCMWSGAWSTLGVDSRGDPFFLVCLVADGIDKESDEDENRCQDENHLNPVVHRENSDPLLRSSTSDRM